MKKRILIAIASAAFAPAAWSQTAPEIITAVQAKYAGLTSLAVEGKVVSDMDMSGVESPVANAAMPKQYTSVHTFTVRLARPELYRIEWSQPVHDSYTNEGAAWSAGDGHHLRLGSQDRPLQKDLDLNLAGATGVSGGAAHTLPSIFFQRPASVLKMMQNPTLLPNEKIGDEDCKVITGQVAGQKLILWVTKDSLLKQRRLVLGGAMTTPKLSDDDIKKSLEQLGQPTTPEAVVQMKQTMQRAQETSSKVKGSMTETYEKIEVNPPLKKESFAVPDR
jgi:hypothetical protein